MARTQDMPAAEDHDAENQSFRGGHLGHGKLFQGIFK